MVAYSYKRRFVTPIRIGLGLSIRPEDQDHDAATLLLPKRQTIRAHGKRRHAREGETLQHYCGMRHPSCFLIGKARCTAVERIIIWPDIMSIMVAAKLQTARQIQAFARQDGFASVADMQTFWLKEHGSKKFEGVLVRWVPL